MKRSTTPTAPKAGGGAFVEMRIAPARACTSRIVWLPSRKLMKHCGCLADHFVGLDLGWQYCDLVESFGRHAGIHPGCWTWSNLVPGWDAEPNQHPCR